MVHCSTLRTLFPSTAVAVPLVVAVGWLTAPANAQTTSRTSGQHTSTARAGVTETVPTSGVGLGWLNRPGIPGPSFNAHTTNATTNAGTEQPGADHQHAATAFRSAPFNGPVPPALPVSTAGEFVRAPATGNALVAGLQACTFGAIAGTFTLAFFLSRGKGPSQGRRSVAIGSKMALAIGGMVSLNLAACWMGVEAIQNATTISVGGLMAAQVSLAVYALFSGAFCIGIGVWLGRDMLKRADRVGQSMRAMAHGDLTLPPINSSERDEIGELARAADSLSAYLKDFVTDLSISSRDLAGTAGQVAVIAKSSDTAGTGSNKRTGDNGHGVNGTNGVVSGGGAALRPTGDQAQDMDRFFRAFATAIQAVASASREAGAGITQCAGAAAELSAKADELMATVGRFRVPKGPGLSQPAGVGTTEYAGRP